MFVKDEILNKKNLFEDFWETCDFSKPLVLYGIGNGIVWYIKLLEKMNCKIQCLCDSSVKEQKVYQWTDDEGNRHTYPIYSLEDVCLKFGKCNFIISAPRHQDAITKKIQSGLYEKIYVFDAAPIVIQDRMPKVFKEYLSDNLEKFNYIYSLMEDDVSREVMKICIEGYLTSDCSCYRDTASSSQYFPDFIKTNLAEEEVFVDIGAFDGDSVEEFIECVEGKFKKIIAFEPDVLNYKIGKEKFQDERVFFYPYGCSDTNECAYIFRENGSEKDAGAYIQMKDTKASGKKIELVKLDDFIHEKITYMKMDIEGMELSALKGSEELIRKYHPKLAICVYHKKEDMLEIALNLKRVYPKYKFYMRHYWNCSGTDIVLFAI